MIRKRRYFPLVGAAVAVVAIVGLIVVLASTKRQGDGALARLAAMATPETRTLIASALKPASAGGTESATQAARSQPPTGQAGGSDSVARYTALFERGTKVDTLDDWRRRFNDKPPTEWTDEEWSQVESAVDALQDFVRAIREAAALGGPAIHLDLSEGVFVKLPHLAPLRQLARMVCLDAWVQARRKHYDVVVEDVIAAMDLSTSLADEPFVICQLVRIGIESIPCDTVKQLCLPGSLSPELAGKLVERAARGYGRESFVRGVAAEARLGADLFDRMRKGTPAAELMGFIGHAVPEWQTRSSAATFGIMLDNPKALLYKSAFGGALRGQDKAACTAGLAVIVEASRLPYYQAVPLLDALDREVAALPKDRFFAHALLDRKGRPSGNMLRDAPASQARVEALLDLMRIGLTLDQYFARTGSYPTSLDAIAPDLGGSVPLDPFTGSAYCYQVLADGYRLYSVGRNLYDDGGRGDAQKDDIVWRGEVKEEEARRTNSANEAKPTMRRGRR